MAGPWEEYQQQRGPWEEYAGAGSKAEEKPVAAQPSTLRSIFTPELDYKNIASGALRGAGSIGSTLLYPLDKARDLIQGELPNGQSRNQQRRNDIDMGLSGMGADPESISYQGGKLGAEIAGTAGVGSVLGNALRAVPAIAKFAPVVESGGFNLGNAGTGNAVANALLRAGGGAVQGGATAGLVDPGSAEIGAGIGAVAPGSIRAAGMAGNAISKIADSTAKSLMQSALKPTLKQQQTGQAERAIQTLLDEGVNPTARGVEKLGVRADEIDSQIKDLIANSQGIVSKQKVLDALTSAKQKFGNQVDPLPDLATIDSVGQRFAAHPQIPTDDISIQLAQELKKGTYQVLKDKYGQVGSADTEAQKALARGLKEQIAAIEPAVAPLNARQSDLVNALKVANRRAMMDQNKNPMGLAAIAPSPAGLAAFLADRSALIKALAARGVNQAGKAVAPPAQLPNMMQQYGMLGAPSVLATSP